MFDKLIDFSINQINQLMPLMIVFQYQKGIRFRFGKYYGTCEPGLHLKIPYVDTIDIINSTETTHTLPVQSLTTKDGKSIIVKGMVKYKIVDIESYFMVVYDSLDALSDISCGIIKTVITEKDWSEAFDNEIDNLISKKIRTQVKRYGIEVIQFTITDISQTKSLRLFNENNLLS